MALWELASVFGYSFHPTLVIDFQYLYVNQVTPKNNARPKSQGPLIAVTKRIV